METKTKKKGNSASCPDPAHLAQLADGSLPEPAFSICLNHIETCTYCENVLSLHLTNPYSPKILDSPPQQFSKSETGIDSPSPGGEKPQALLPFPHSLPPFPPPDNSGDLGKVGRFRILKLLYPGHIAYTYKGFDTQLNRPVALKILRPSLSRDPEWRTAFLSEAQTASALSSLNIIPIHHVDQLNELTFFVMPLLNGGTLAKKLRAGPLSSTSVAKIGLGILNGLETAHKAGIIHRDIKPNNIWLKPEKTGSDPEPVLFDFGIASTTKHGIQSTGTRGYNSPEQSQGKPGDFRSDFFSFGCVLFEMITGKMAFPNSLETDTIARPLDSPSLPKEWRPLIEELLELDPEKRPIHHENIRLKLLELTKPQKKSKFFKTAITLAILLSIILSVFLLLPFFSPRFLDPVQEFRPPSVLSNNPTFALGNDGAIFRGFDEKKILANLPDGTKALFSLSKRPIQFTWSPPYLAVIDQDESISILELKENKTREVIKYLKPQDISVRLTGLDWSPTENHKLLVAFGNQLFTTEKIRNEFSANLVPQGQRITEIAQLNSSTYMWQPHKGHVLGTMLPGGITSVDLNKGKHVFGFRHFFNGPPSASFSADSTLMATISPKGEMELFHLGMDPYEKVLKNLDGTRNLLPDTKKDLEVDVAEIGFVTNDWIAIRIPGETRFPIRLVGVNQNERKPIFLNTQGKRILDMATDPNKHLLAAFAADQSVFLFDCSNLK